MPEPAVIKVRLPAQLRHYNDGSEETTLPHSAGATIADYIEKLDIPGHEYMGVFIDGTLTGDHSLVLEPGAELELVPAMSGG